ncbi:TIGR01440 family protein [Bacillus sp. HMF5848]|uniref:TIGR01440 family protein n=1 Tax=Bacillus sp. HMF5848 TaxID=2495421 RepID=UPI0026D9C07B
MVEQWRGQFQTLLMQFGQQVSFSKDKLLIVGCSTSEIIGKKIGTAGSSDVAEMIFSELKKQDVQLAFQCCEHLNRAIVVERKTAIERGYEIVNVIPVPEAGGAMAAHAYERFNDPVMVEFVKSDLGIDIGDTFIGMHLKHVAVPIRTKIKEIGHAHVTLATTRPKLIGGARAVYTKDSGKTCFGE